MKVLFVEHHLPGSVYTLELAREMVPYADVSIFCKKTAGVSGHGIHWIPKFYPGEAGKVRGLMEYGKTILDLTQTIRQGKFDVVHVQSFKKEAVEMRLYRALRKYYGKLVFTVHNVVPHESGESAKAVYAGWYALCDELIVHNEASKECLMETFQVPEEKITVIAHGAYQTYDLSAPRTNTDPRKHYLLFGRIRPYKGVDILIKAVSLIDKETRKKMHFTIIGKQYPKIDGTDYGQLVRDYGCEDCIDFSATRVDDKDVPGLYANHDIAVFPYRKIYGSGILLMGYTFHKPVIASAIPTFLEETDNGRTGVLFEPENPEDLARVLVESLDWTEEQVAGYQSAITELVENKYNWAISAKQTVDVYSK